MLERSKGYDSIRAITKKRRGRVVVRIRGEGVSHARLRHARFHCRPDEKACERRRQSVSWEDVLRNSLGWNRGYQAGFAARRDAESSAMEADNRQAPPSSRRRPGSRRDVSLSEPPRGYVEIDARKAADSAPDVSILILCRQTLIRLR